MRFKPAIHQVNHCEITTSTTGGTELNTTVFVGIDALANRGTNIPEGAVLTWVKVELWATDATPVAGKHQCMLTYRPGGEAFTTTSPITSWFLTTDPLTEDAIAVRRLKLGRGPHTTVTVTGASGPPHFICFWRGRKLIHDGDDVVLSQLDAGSTAWTATCEARYTF